MPIQPSSLIYQTFSNLRTGSLTRREGGLLAGPSVVAPSRWTQGCALNHIASVRRRLDVLAKAFVKQDSLALKCKPHCGG